MKHTRFSAFSGLLLLLGAATASLVPCTLLATPRVWVGGTSGLVMRWNATQGWTSHDAPTGRTINAFYFVDDQTGWTVEEDGRIRKTIKGGKPWELTLHPTNEDIRDVWFHDYKTGWAVGTHGLILKTTDWGVSWSEQHPTTPALLSVSFTDDEWGWTVGDNGIILHTSDGGTTWRVGGPSFGYSLRDVFFLDRQFGWAVGANGMMLSTTDGGLTWSRRHIFPLNTLRAVLFLTRDQGFAVGDSGTLLRSDDGGVSWSRIEVTSENLFDVAFAGDSGWVVGDAGTVLVTTDGGEQWAVTYPTTRDLRSVYVVDPPSLVSLELQTEPSQRYITLDGMAAAGSTVRSVPGMTRVLAATTPQEVGRTRYEWSHWSDGGDATHAITPTEDGSYTAYFDRLYELKASSSLGGTVSPDTSWWLEGSEVNLVAVPDAGYVFSQWLGYGEGSYTGRDNPALVVMDAPLDQRATFVPSSASCPSGPVVFVDSRKPAGGDGDSWETAFNSLQDALNLPADCPDVTREIWVAAGTYKPTEGTDRSETFQLGNNLALYGGFSGNETSREQRDWITNETILSGDIGVPGDPILDAWQGLRFDQRMDQDGREILREWSKHAQAVAEGSAGALATEDNSNHVVTAIGVDSSCVLDGFTVAYGLASLGDGGSSRWRGGGLIAVSSEIQVSNTKFQGNTAYYQGGGVASVDGGHPAFHNVTWVGNRSLHTGAGMTVWESSASVLQGEFSHNWATIYAGGASFYPNGSPLSTLNDVLFYENIGDDVCGGLGGSGLRLEGVVFDGNWSQGSGGGMSGTGTLINVLFRGNSAAGFQVPPTGGGGGGMSGGGTLVNVAFIENVTSGQGGGLRGGGQLINVTCVGNRSANEGGGIYLDNSPSTVTNAVVAGNSSSRFESDQGFSEGGSSVLSHTLVQGSGGSGSSWDPSLGLDGGGNIDADPRFVDPANGDYRLRRGSPAIDTGNSNALPSDVTTDLDGNPRISGLRVDMGAYEYPCETFEVVFGDSWDGISLQDVLDAEYGPGVISAATGYEGRHCGDAGHPYWFDAGVDGWLVREIAGNASTNVFGWHVEDFNPPVIDGIDDDVIFDGSSGPGATASVVFPGGPIRFGFYLNPNGSGDAENAPEPEHFFVNRVYNDEGPDGGGDSRAPEGGDPQCLIYNVTHLRGGVPTYVLAWEDFDYGGQITPQYQPGATDNDFQDLVVEIQAMSPVAAVSARLDAVTTRRGIQLWWRLQNPDRLDMLELRRHAEGVAETVVQRWESEIAPAGTFLDAPTAGDWRYYLAGRVEHEEIRSPEIEVAWDATPSERVELLGATPNPFNPSTKISFNLPKAMHARLDIFDVSGRLVTTLVDGPTPAGLNSVTWTGQDRRDAHVSSGSYFCRLTAGQRTETVRVVLLK